MAGTGGGARGGTGAETGRELTDDDPNDDLGGGGREDECWGGGRDDWSRDVRRSERRREPSVVEVYEVGLAVVLGREEVEVPRPRGREDVEVELDDGKAIPLAESAGEAGRGMLDIEPGTGRYVGVWGREGIADRIELARLLDAREDGRLCCFGAVPVL